MARHEAEIFEVPVYDSPHARAAALLQLLIHVPALERSNALFAVAVAYAYLVAGGLKVTTSPEQVRDLARLVKGGQASVHDIAHELRRWTLCDYRLSADASVAGRHAVPSTQYDTGSFGPFSGIDIRR
ncbi:hypothetical protein SALBM311S_08894 [Streptomyces alboniger]